MTEMMQFDYLKTYWRMEMTMMLRDAVSDNKEWHGVRLELLVIEYHLHFPGQGQATEKNGWTRPFSRNHSCLILKGFILFLQRNVMSKPQYPNQTRLKSFHIMCLSTLGKEHSCSTVKEKNVIWSMSSVWSGRQTDGDGNQPAGSAD